MFKSPYRTVLVLVLVTVKEGYRSDVDHTRIRHYLYIRYTYCISSAVAVLCTMYQYLSDLLIGSDSLKSGFSRRKNYCAH